MVTHALRLAQEKQRHGQAHGLKKPQPMQDPDRGPEPATAPRSPEHRCSSVEPDRLASLVIRAPRYTSYPPATRFAPSFGPREAAAELERLRRDAPGSPISLYVHVPFCRSLCWYCGCNVVVTRRRDRGSDYTDVLVDELALLARAAGQDRPVSELALGGGSPNFLRPRDLERLFRAVRGCFQLAADADISVELDPRDTTAEQIQVLADQGLTRVSVGVQDFDPAVQDAIHRFQSVEQTRDLFESARRRGVEHMNADLVYGLPRQTLDSFGRTLDAVVALAPSRIALFGYAHVPDLRPQQKLVERAGALPDARARAELFALAEGRLGQAGYLRLGIDHFARPEDPLAVAAASGRLSRNFQGYVVKRAEALLACGATGISDSGSAYWQNHADLARWAGEVAARRLPVARGVALDGEDRRRREVITRILCDGRLDFAALDASLDGRFEDLFGAELDRLDSDPELAELCRIDRSTRTLTATPLGSYVLRNIASVFDAYLAPASDRPARRFSLTL